jgi:hypothetical protein
LGHSLQLSGKKKEVFNLVWGILLFLRHFPKGPFKRLNAKILKKKLNMTAVGC